MSKYLKLLIITMLWMVIAMPLNSQTIKGEVADKQTLEKIAGATIRLNALKTITGKNGDFILAVNDSVITLVISATGYKTDTVVVRAGKQFFTLLLQSATQLLEDVVVSGNMRAVSKSESAIPVELFQAKFFKKNPTPSLFEALSMVNGVQPQLNCNICNTGDIHINGMEGPYTMILIDGMPVMSSLSRIYGISGIPTGIIKRMEVVNGAASTLYGSDAVAGLINIITKDATGAGKLNADISVTGLQELNADINTGIITKNASGIIAVNTFNYWKKHDINHDNFTDVTQQRRLSLFTKWSFSRGNQLPFDISLRALAENRWGGELRWNKNYRGSNKLYGESIVTSRAELSGVYGLKGGINNINIDYSYSFHRQDSYYGITRFFATQHVAFAQLTGNKTIKKHQLLWGFPFRFIAYDDNTFLTEKDNGNAVSKQFTASAFAQDEWKINQKLLLLGGLRYEYQNIQGSVISPRLAIKWTPHVNSILRLSAGNGYRVVNLYTEDHASLTGAREVVIANNLAPEKSWNINLNYNGSMMTHKAFFNVDASVFYTRFSNKIIADYETDATKIIYDNLSGYAISKGLTINTDIIIKKGPKLMAGLTLMDVFTNEQNAAGEWQKQRQMFAPVFSASYSIAYTLNALRLVLDVTGKTYGPQRLPIVPNDYRPACSPWFSLINLQLTKKTNGVFEYYFAIKNLLNFQPKNPLLHPDDPFNTAGGKYFDADKKPRQDTNPFGYRFDTSYSYAPMQATKCMIGVRLSL